MLAARHTATNLDKFALLNCKRLPARLNVTETAVLLGLKDHDVPPLIAAELLVPLGKPAPNAPKYFAAVDIVACSEDREWLSNATRLLAKHWQRKNSRSSPGLLFGAA